MCYFITIGLPEDKAQFLEDHIPRGFHIAPIENLSVLEQMGRGFRTYLLMSGGCSCSLFNEPRPEAKEAGQTREHSRRERLRRKYEKMGWSAAKIDRALTQLPRGREGESFTGLRGDVQHFVGELALNVGEVAVVAHWYDGDVQETRLTLKPGRVVSPETALEEGLLVAAGEILRIKSRE